MKRFILIALLVIIAGLIVLNYVGANEAEKQIDKAIQMQADSADFSAQYSSVDVSPFRGNIDFSDVTFVQGNDIQRAHSIHVDLRYIDFLHIYLGGVKYGLENLSSGNMQFKKLSYLNRETMKEFSAHSADLTYDGNLWNGVRYMFFNDPLDHRQQVDIIADSLRYNEPNGAAGAFKSDSAFVHLNWDSDTEKNSAVRDSVSFENITWTPPKSFQQKYAFFIQGFGYKLDAIPIKNTGFAFSDFTSRAIHINSGQTQTDLFTIQFDGSITRDSTWTTARFTPLNVSLTNLSEKFKNVLANIEQLLGTQIPRQQGKIKFQLVGPLSKPHIAQNNLVGETR